ncbi:MAG: DUF3857 domain-containing protein [Candidatus Cyclobacteriaceae bacterium M2_1C_046]
MKNLTIIAILFFTCTIVYAQKPPFKFGKIEKEEIEIEKCDFYPEAHSMILGQYGELRFMYSDSENTFKYQMDVTVRKKIFNKTDKDAGSFKIKYYHPVSGGAKENISSLKAYTYNIEKGKVTKTKLDKSGKFENRLNDYWQEISVTMPDVQEGSVIEYTYTITSELISNLQTWYLQEDIPVQHSELRVTLPEFYHYQVSTVGNVIPIEHELNTVTEAFRYSYKRDVPLTGTAFTREKTEYTNLESKSVHRRFVTKNVKPVIDEPYTNNKVDLPTRIEFQLISVKFPNSTLKQIASTYEAFNKTLMDNSSFGGRLNKGNFAKEYISLLEGKNELEKAASIYGWIKSNITWDGYNSLTSEKAGGAIFNSGKGNVADINLTLVAALKEAGLNAHPVILSTRGHGVPHPIYPSYDEFNYVVAIVAIEDQYFFLDGTSALPFGMLPVKCLNNKGWMVNENGGSWISMKINNPHQSISMIMTNVLEDKIENKVQLKEEFYATLQDFNTINRDGEEKFKEKLAGSFPEWEFDEFSLESNSISEGVSYNFTLSKERDDEDIIYLQPLLIGTERVNPFNREERYSQIDFECQYSKRVFNTITIPEGYVAELPEPGIIKLPGNGGTFIFNISQTGQNIQVMSDLKLNQTEFTADEYIGLKQFFQLMVEKNNSMIVLKKI